MELVTQDAIVAKLVDFNYQEHYNDEVTNLTKVIVEPSNQEDIDVIVKNFKDCNSDN